MAYISITETQSRGKTRFKAKVRKKNGSLKEQCISKTFDTAIEAEIWATMTKSELEGVIPTPLSKCSKLFSNTNKAPITQNSSIKEIINYFLEEDAKAPNGYCKTYISALRQINTYNISLLMPTELSWDVLVDFCQQRLETSLASTVRIDISALTTALKETGEILGLDFSHETIEKHRAKLKKKKYIADPAIRIRRLQDNEEMKILNTLKDYDNKPKVKVSYTALIKLYIETCLRRSELVSITWGDIDEDNKLIRVTKIQKSKPGTTTTPRFIPLLNDMSTILNSIKPDNAKPSDKIFNIKPSTVSKVFNKVVKVAEIVDLNLHDLRTEAISRYLELGLTVNQVAVFSGHKDRSIIDKIYDQIDAKNLTSKIEYLNLVSNAESETYKFKMAA